MPLPISTTIAPTLAAPPSTANVANQILSTMAALSSVVSDFNQGSQIRSLAESMGSVEEQQGVWSTALAFQTLVYSALSLFGITPGVAQLASGVVTFTTSTGSAAPAASQNIPIPQGTVVQTTGGVQFQTTSGATLASGTAAVDAPIQALTGGAVGNVPIDAITQIITGLTYPLVCFNASGTNGGADASSSAASLATFAAIIASIGLSSPVAIANAAIGVSKNNEVVAFSTLYEPFVTASGAASGQAGWTLYIDNGSGTASMGLITNVTAKLNGSTSSGASNASGAIGYRDAGVPFSVAAITPTNAWVTVSGASVPGTNLSALNTEISNAVNAYFQLPFGTPAENSQLSAQIANATLGQLTSLNVTLASASSGANQQIITPPVSGRMLLQALVLQTS